MKTETVVYVRTTFVGYHRWLNAPDQVAFLRDYHRHVFHVKLVVQVNHNNRDVEFFTLKEDLESYLKARWANHYFEQSCEMIAFAVLANFTDRYKVFSCEVSEDNENGAVVWVKAEVPEVRDHFVEDDK